MLETPLPKAAEDVLSIPIERVPETVRQMLHARKMTPLMARIHEGLRSGDPVARRNSKLALRHLGFPD